MKRFVSWFAAGTLGAVMALAARPRRRPGRRDDVRPVRLPDAGGAGSDARGRAGADPQAGFGSAADRDAGWQRRHGGHVPACRPRQPRITRSRTVTLAAMAPRPSTGRRRAR